jgi:hypothetical protein
LNWALASRTIEAGVEPNIVDSAKFTTVELAALVVEASSWLEAKRAEFLPSGAPLNNIQKANLSPFLSAQVLNAVRIVNLSKTGKTIPYPPFYERVRAGGHRVVPDSAHMAALPFVDVVVFNGEPTLRTIFHNLVHVTQFAVVGLETAMECYFRILNDSGLWMVVPFEEQAYRMDARYTRDPNDFFSVEAEVREWLRKGRYC